jgi:hypothetical protein
MRLRAFLFGMIVALVAGVVAVPNPSRTLAADENDFQGWFQATGSFSVDQNKKYQAFLEIQPRMGANWERFDRLFVRPALTYNVRPDVGVSLGYAWIPYFLDVELHRTFGQEQRLWQQLLFRHESGNWQWQHRLRPEQRFLEGVEGVSNRLRYFIRGSYSLDPDGSFGLTGFEEFFVTLNSTDQGPKAGYDRNRVFFGPFWREGAMRYEVGYVLEHVHRFGNDQRWVSAVWSSIVFDL